jgi:hypothetical protein
VVDFPSPGTPMRAGAVAGESPSRRSLLLAGVGWAAGLVVSGCDVHSPAADDRIPKGPARLAPDVAVATSALAEIRTARTAVSGTLSRFPGTRPQLASLVWMHQAHEMSLADAVPDRARTTTAPAPYVVPRKRELAFAKVAASEQRLHDTLDGLALRAQSGDFARLLASMGAAVTQQLAVWEP